MRAVQNGVVEDFFGSDVFFSFDIIARNAESLAGYVSAASGMEQFTDILRSAAGISAFFENGDIIGGDVFTAYRKVMNGNSGTRGFFAVPVIDKESAAAAKYSADLVMTRSDIPGTADAAEFGNYTRQLRELLVNSAVKSENRAVRLEMNFAFPYAETLMSGRSTVPLLSGNISSGYEIGDFLSVGTVFGNGGFAAPLSAGVRGYGDLMYYDNASAASDPLSEIFAVTFGRLFERESGDIRISGSGVSDIISGDYVQSFNIQKPAFLETGGDDTQFLRESAARYSINQYIEERSASPTDGDVFYSNGNVDYDSIADYFINGVKTALESAAEGVHS